MWDGENLRVPWSIVQFVLALLYKLLSFVFGALLSGYSCTESPALRMKYWMLCLRSIYNTLSSKWMSWPSQKSTQGFRGEEQHMEAKWVIGLCQQSLSIFPDGELLTTQSLFMLKCRSWVQWVLLCTTTGGMKHCQSVRVEMSDVHQNGALSPFWVLHSLSPVKNLQVHTPYSSYHLYQIQSLHNSTLAMDNVVCRVGWLAIIVHFLEGSVLSIDIYGVTKKMREA